MSSGNGKLQNATDKYFRRNVHFISEPLIVRMCLKNNWDKILRGELKYVILDAETTSLDPWADWAYYYSKREGKVVAKDWGGRVFSLQFGFYSAEADRLNCVYVDVEDEESMAIAEKILCWRELTIVGHNIKFDVQMCENSGIKFRCKIWDTLTASRLTHDRLPKHDLKWLGNFFSGKSGSDTDKWEVEVKSWLKRARAEHTRQGFPKDYVNYSFVPNEIMTEYALKDVWYTFLIFTLLSDEIEMKFADVFDIEINVIWYLMRMEKRGVRVNRRICNQAIRKLDKRVNMLEDRIDLFACEMGNTMFNPNSPKQLKEMILKSGIPESALIVGDKVTTNKKVLEEVVLQYPESTFLNDIMLLRTCRKLKDTYFESIYRRSRVDGIVHCNLKASDTKTSRCACVNPNLQNIPRPGSAAVKGIPTVRKVFIPRVGYMNFYFDYSQIEMRMFALFGQLFEMFKAFEAGRDLHTETARLMFGKSSEKYRQMAKAINFGIIFGMGVKRLASQLKITYAKAKELMNEYYRRFPGIYDLQKACTRSLHSQGYVEGIFGRRYHVPRDKAYVAVNSLVQGDSAMVLKVAELQTERLFRCLSNTVGLGEDDANPLLVIHDEQKVEIRKRHANWLPPLIKMAMEEIPCVLQYGLKTTVDIEYSNPEWESKSDWNIESCDMVYANKWWEKHKDKVVIPWNRKKVDWFIKAS